MSSKAFGVVQKISTNTNTAHVKGKSVVIQTDSKGEKSFSYDDAFVADDIDDFYSKHLSKTTHEVLSGFNVSVTCLGLKNNGSGQILHGVGFDANNGIVPKIIKDLFAQINSTQYLVSASMLQIDKNGDLLDVLNPHTRKMKIKHNQKSGIYVENLSSIVCSNANEALGLYTEGFKVETSMKKLEKDVVFTLYISNKMKDISSSGILSKITIFDLNGHEYDQENTGIKALFKALSKGKVGKESISSTTNQLLHDCFLNSASSSVIACISDEGSDVDGMLHLLELVKSTSGIRLSPQKNSGNLEKALSSLRQDIKIVRDRMMQQTIPKKSDVTKLEDLLADLNAVKKTAWEQQIVLSNQFVEERKKHLSNRGLLWVMESRKSSNHDKIKQLKNQIDKLTAEYKKQKTVSEKVKDDLRKEIEQYTKLVESGKSDQKDTKARITRIQQMKEAYKKESEKNDKLKEGLKQCKDQLRREQETGLDIGSFNFEMTLRKLEEDRTRMKNENQQMLDEEVDKMKVELAHEKAELEMRSASGGLQFNNQDLLKTTLDLAALKLEKSTITTQLDVLKKENKQMDDHILALAEKHSREVEIQQLQNLQTFRAYREVFEEFKVDLENRWRGLLDDAIQDAVFLNSKNNELSQENEKLKMDVKELKDALSLTGATLGNKSAIKGV